MRSTAPGVGPVHREDGGPDYISDRTVILRRGAVVEAGPTAVPAQAPPLRECEPGHLVAVAE